jgi:hypothetical protein
MIGTACRDLSEYGLSFPSETHRLRRLIKLIFYSADSQVIERTRESALETRLGTTFPVIG